MIWCDQLASELADRQTINDSKTPSGRVHVGALRGVLVHDAMYRALLDRDVPTRYLFGVDDYDPLDELPAGEEEQFRSYLGMPLCDVPAPRGSEAGDMAEHYIGEFFEIFDELGVCAEKYRMRDIYRSGDFDEAIDTILTRADLVRQIDREVANTRRPDDWHPLQVICEQCGRIGTSYVYAYDGSKVSYRCEPNLVKWARGCGHSGRISPFSGRAKLSWKLEWVAKWKTFPVTIEGAGRDHNTKGGSRAVAARCMREIFDREPPLNIPYEFFLVGGAKMSSSRGLGASAREMADLLPPELLRFLMLRVPPKRTVDFSPTETKIVGLYDEFDRMRRAATADPDSDPARLFRLSSADAGQPHDPGYFSPSFHLVLSLAQQPHIDLRRKVEEMKGEPLTELEQRKLDERLASARTWLERYAIEEEKLELKAQLTESALALRPRQRAFLRLLATDLQDVPWDGEAIQGQLFATARRTPIAYGEAFGALYQAFFGRDSGPRAGNLLAFLDREPVAERLAQLPIAVPDYWLDTAVDEEEVEDWLARVAPRLSHLTARLRFFAEAQAPGTSGGPVEGLGVVDLLAALDDDTVQCLRTGLWTFTADDAAAGGEYERFADRARSWIATLAERVDVPVETAESVVPETAQLG